MIERKEAQAAANRIQPITLDFARWRPKLVKNGVQSLSADELVQLRADLGREILALNRRASDLETLNTYVVDRIMGLRFG